MAKKKQFKAESKRLLELMINSIYTHKEIYLRELISNASDALDKLYYKSIKENLGLSRQDFAIRLFADKDARTITITDNGIGMTPEELENNLGVIAKSGSMQFKLENEKAEDISVIGQFGVGFYSAFMIAEKVIVKSKAYGSDQAYQWESEGAEGFTVEPCEKEGHGTEITLFVKPSDEENDYDDFLMTYKIKSLVKKYSDYIRYPIILEEVVSKKKEGTENEYEDVTEYNTVNSMIPIWKKQKSELTDEEYNQFYKDKFYDFNDPMLHIHSHTEGTATYDALLYIPSKAPYDYYTKEYEKGLMLYSSGVLIMDKCADLLPDYFSFVKGLVDSEDLSLNISREMLQHDRQLKLIAKSLERSIKNELKKTLNNNREQYESFWNTFGTQIKFGLYNSYGMKRDVLEDLLMFYSSTEKKLVTLEEYTTRMKEDQKEIFYAAGESIARIEALPQVEIFKEKGIEVLYLTDKVDEFTLQILRNYKEKEFKSIQSNDFNLQSEEEKEAVKKLEEENEALLKAMKEALNEEVEKVVLSSKLKSHPVCVTNEGDVSLDMEKTLKNMPVSEDIKARKVLELNPNHPLFEKLKSLLDSDKERLSLYSEILYQQALLIEGMPLENPLKFTEKILKIML
jgi:molecular chaperone HtpG